MVGIYVMKRYADALRRIGVGDDGVGFKVFSAGVDLEEYFLTFLEGFKHLHETAVKTEFRELGGNAGLSIFLEQFYSRDERIPWSAASFVFHEFTSKEDR